MLRAGLIEDDVKAPRVRGGSGFTASRARDCVLESLRGGDVVSIRPLAWKRSGGSGDLGFQSSDRPTRRYRSASQLAAAMMVGLREQRLAVPFGQAPASTISIT